MVTERVASRLSLRRRGRPSLTTRRSVEWVEQSDPAALEIRNIPRHERDASDQGGGGDEHIRLSDGPTLLRSSCPEAPRGERHLRVDMHDLWRRLGAKGRVIGGQLCSALRSDGRRKHEAELEYGDPSFER